MDYIRACIDELCTDTVITAVHLLPPEASTYTDLIMSGGFDPELTKLGFFGVMGLWAAGLTVGIIVQQIRKLR